MKRVALFLSFILSVFLSASAWAIVDNTFCTVRRSGDDVSNSNSGELRNAVQAHSRPSPFWMCTDLIIFDNDVTEVELNAPLSIGNPDDHDCANGIHHPEVCGDGWDLLIDGGESFTAIDVSALDPNICAITLSSEKIQIKNINFIASAAQINNRKVICANAPNIDISQNLFNGASALEPTYNLGSTIVAGGKLNSYQARLTWGYPQPAFDFNFAIERATKNSLNQCQGFSQINRIDGRTTNYTDTSIQNGTGYCYRVRAVRLDIVGFYSNTIKVTIPGSPASGGGGTIGLNGRP